MCRIASYMRFSLRTDEWDAKDDSTALTSSSRFTARTHAWSGNLPRPGLGPAEQPDHTA